MTDKIPEMVERVAKQICRSHFARRPHVGSCTAEERLAWLVAHYSRDWIPDARAAIAAMHDPTKAMINSADKLDRGTLYDPRELDPEEIWKAMIDEAMR